MDRIVYKTVWIPLVLLLLVSIAGFSMLLLQHTSPANDCASQGQDARLTCFKDEVTAMMRTQSVTSAIAHLVELANAHADVRNECHGIMHALGETAYHIYTSGIAFDVTPEITYCTYGFYHGFITEAVLEEGTFTFARDFCAYVNEALAEQGITSESECYHGFGHAAVDDHISTQFLTGSAVTKNALALCAEVAETVTQRRDCASGVYNGVANIFLNHTYAWPEIEDGNVLYICEQEEEFKEVCYGFFARVFVHNNHDDLALALSAVQEIPEVRLRTGTVSNTSSYYMLSKHEKTVEEAELHACRNLPLDLHLACIGGLSVGLVQSALPTHEYETARTFCERADLTEKERGICFQKALEHVQPLVKNTVFEAVCASTPEEYRVVPCAL